jgi:hypothetical protein
MSRRARPRGGHAALFTILLTALFLNASCAAGGLFGKRYEYEEDLTLDLDGSATLTVNASIPALIALRGLDIDTTAARVDRDRIRALYESSVADVRRVSRPWRRNGRTYVQIRLAIADIRRLSDAAPFSWSRYELTRNGDDSLYRQTVGASAFKPGTLKNVGWEGSEVVAFRLHLPSRILEHNSRSLETDEPTSVQRGNIVAWEQHLSDRLDGKPITISVRMSSQSILHRTLWLFGGAFAAAVLVLVALIWMAMRRGKSPQS